MFGVFGIWVCVFGIWEVDLAPLPLLLGISDWFLASGFGSIPDSQFSILVLIHFPWTNSQQLLIVWWTQILDPVLATVASLSNLQNLRKSGVAKKIAESQNRACPEWRCLYNNGGKAERSPVSNLPSSLQNQNPNFTTGPDRRLNAGRGDRDDWKMHPFTKVRGNFVVSASVSSANPSMSLWCRCSRRC